jgi:hypothetical protein
LLPLDSEENTPSAFIVHQPPRTTVRPHFHDVDQFQIVMGGNGWLGRTAVQPIWVHYANAFTGYGPIVSGSEGIDYYTLRPRSTSAAPAQFLPDARQEMRKVARRQLSGFCEKEACSDMVQLLPRADDGLAATYVPVPRRTTRKLHGGNGQGSYYLIIVGSLEIGRVVLGAGSLIYLDRAETFMATAGSAEAAYLELVFGTPTAEPQTR